MKAVDRADADSSAVGEYKRLLQSVLENRPAGTRRRLAEALGKNRSFVSQITNPAYSVPIPAPHLETIFEVCHFLATEKKQFLAIYARAHPNRAPGNQPVPRWREVVLRVPELHDREKNKLLDELLKDTVQKIVRMVE